eukprot:gene18175-19989_t
MATATPLLLARKQEKDYMSSLNDRFASYVSRVRQMRDQSNRLEASAINATTKKLEDEIFSLKAIYERELEDMRVNLDAVTNDRNQFQVSSSKNAALASEYQDKLADELNTRKKLENALADAQRVISEKESLLQDARITITQHQNSHLDTQKDRDSLHTALTDTQGLYDAEVVAHNDMKSVAAQLKDKLSFERKVHEKDMQDLKDRLAYAYHSLDIAEERLHEHNLLDENLTAMLAKVKVQSEAELRRFREESELTYQNSLQQVKNELQNEANAHAATTEELIHLKSVIDQLNAKIVNLESKCASTDQQNSSLIQTLEVERQQAANTIQKLEEKLRTLQEHLNEKIRELGLAYNANAPLDLELEAFGAILEAEEKRLSLAASGLPKSYLTRSATFLPRPVSPLLARAQTSPASVIEAKATAAKAKISRPKSVPDPANSKGSLPFLTNSSRRKNLTEATPTSVLYSSCPDPITTKLAPPQRWTYVPNYVDYHNPSTSHTGNVRILEVNPDGRYVRLFNTSAFLDEEIGSFMLQQNVGGKPVSIFRFPPRTRLKANAHITVWSACSHARHSPPSDFLWKEQHKWSTGPECTTIFCKPNGQAIAWTTASYPYGNPNFIATREDANEDPIDAFANTGNSSMTQPETKPFATSPRNSIHPGYSKSRAARDGNEARTKNPQSRSQKHIVTDDSLSKSSRIGGNTGRYTVGGTKKQTGIIRMSPSVKKYDSASNGYSSYDNLSRFSSQQRVSFQPPMPKPGQKVRVK